MSAEQWPPCWSYFKLGPIPQNVSPKDFCTLTQQNFWDWVAFSPVINKQIIKMSKELSLNLAKMLLMCPSWFSVNL